MAIHRVEFMNNDGDQYTIDLTDTWALTRPSSATYEYDCTRTGFEKSYHPTDSGTLFTPSFPSSVKWTLLVRNSTQYNQIQTVLDDTGTKYYLIIYKKPSGGSYSIHWHGFPQLQTSSETYEYYPQEIRLEAFDHLTLAGTQTFWGRKLDYNVSPTSSVYGMGWRLNVDPTTTDQIPSAGFDHDLGSPTRTTFLGMIMSALFDADNTQAQRFLKVMNWDTKTSTTLPDGGRFFYAWKTTIEPLLYKYDPAWTPASHVKKDFKMLDLINDMMILTRSRIFQYDGDYHIVQWEAYNEISGGGASLQWYSNNKDSAYPTGAEIQFPKTSASSSISNANLFTNLDAPRTDPEILKGGSIRYENIISKVRIDYIDYYQQDGKTTEGFGLSVNSLSSLPFNAHTNAREVNRSLDIDLILNDVSNSLIQFGFNRYNTSTTVNDRIIQQCLRAHHEYSNGKRDRVKFTLTGDHSFLKAIDFGSKTYVHTNYVYHAGMNEHMIEATELTATTSDQAELTEVTAGGGEGHQGNG